MAHSTGSKRVGVGHCCYHRHLRSTILHGRVQGVQFFLRLARWQKMQGISEVHAVDTPVSCPVRRRCHIVLLRLVLGLPTGCSPTSDAFYSEAKCSLSSCSTLWEVRVKHRSQPKLFLSPSGWASPRSFAPTSVFGGSWNRYLIWSVHFLVVQSSSVFRYPHTRHSVELRTHPERKKRLDCRTLTGHHAGALANEKWTHHNQRNRHCSILSSMRWNASSRGDGSRHSAKSCSTRNIRSQVRFWWSMSLLVRRHRRAESSQLITSLMCGRRP